MPEPYRPKAALLACPACGYGCCCCHCECQTPCTIPDQDGCCDCEQNCHGGHPPLLCHNWSTRYAALTAETGTPDA